MSRQENSTLVNEHALNREPVPLTGDQALLYHHFLFLWFEREKITPDTFIQQAINRSLDYII